MLLLPYLKHKKAVSERSRPVLIKKWQAASVDDLSPAACHFLIMLFQPLNSEAHLQIPQKEHNAALGEELDRLCNNTTPACFHGKLSASEARGLWIPFLSTKLLLTELN